eukprot:14328269-Alexandrium_andersonii.AAC.1
MHVNSIGCALMTLMILHPSAPANQNHLKFAFGVKSAKKRLATQVDPDETNDADGGEECGKAGDNKQASCSSSASTATLAPPTSLTTTT